MSFFIPVLLMFGFHNIIYFDISYYFKWWPDMRIVPLGSGGEIWDPDWFLNYCKIKLTIQVSETEGNDKLLPDCTY